MNITIDNIPEDSGEVRVQEIQLGGTDTGTVILLELTAEEVSLTVGNGPPSDQFIPEVDAILETLQEILRTPGLVEAWDNVVKEEENE